MQDTFRVREDGRGVKGGGQGEGTILVLVEKTNLPSDSGERRETRILTSIWEIVSRRMMIVIEKGESYDGFSGLSRRPPLAIFRKLG